MSKKAVFVILLSNWTLPFGELTLAFHLIIDLQEPMTAKPSLRTLFVPGFTGSGPGHWQTLWQRRIENCRRVEQRDWNNPDRQAWLANLSQSIDESPTPVVLVGHSLGAITIAALPRHYDTRRVLGAWLVAPADIEAETAPIECQRFGSVPLASLPFKSQLICAEDDPLISTRRVREFAEAWGSELFLLPTGGHLSTVDGYGEWPTGLQSFAAFLSLIQPTQP